ncbi:MAG: RluA family pseudouridine synthase [Verrucomicrobia bacterium]|nr:RluA family pseudouridine synthase [Verrucomicrobiota bacterium]
MSAPNETIIVAASALAGRLDTFLHARFPAVSRSHLQRLIEQGHVRVNGRAVKPTHAPHAGERIEICWPDATPAAALPEEIPLEILFEDKHLLVVNKSPDIVVHPAAGHVAGTLVNALLHHCAGSLSGIGGVARPGIVHRLDQETSGCLVVAKNDAAHLALAEQFAGRTVEKIYHALVCGAPPADSGEIRAAIARHPVQRKRMAVVEASKGRSAWTSYRVLEKFSAATLVEATIHTGRTHQIRVHFAHLGCPVVGDATYGARPNKRFGELTGITAPRQMLHASTIAFTHPQTGKKLKFTAPWPEDFAATVKRLKKISTAPR